MYNRYKKHIKYKIDNGIIKQCAFSINIWNLLTLSAVLMCSGKLFHKLVPCFVREFRPWLVVLHFGCMMILLGLRLYDNFFSLNRFCIWR